MRQHRLPTSYSSLIPQATLEQRNLIMLWTVILLLMVLWLLGLLTSYTMGGLIHILVVVALVVLILRLIQGRRLMM